MNNLKYLISSCTAFLIYSLASINFAAAAYDYPISNPLAATIVGTPAAFKAKLPEEIDIDEETLPFLKGRILPPGFWYNEELKYSVAAQNKPAPLIYIIAGTGASYQSHKMIVMQKYFFSEGFHVVNITSPSHPNFIVSSSKYSMPGNLWSDAIDIHNVLKKIHTRLKDDIKITDTYLAGYSLGASHSAFVSAYDEQEKYFNFKRVLLINPPVSLYNSVGILDAMLDDSAYGYKGGVGQLIEKIFDKVVEEFQKEDFTEFGEDFLFDAYRKKRPSDAAMATLIGLSFRISSSSMIFTADVMNNYGFVFPKDQELGITTATGRYFGQLTSVSFRDYIKDMFYPYFSSLNPGTSLEKLISASSLKVLDNYIRNNPKFTLVTNEDDIILAPGEIDYLKDLFKNRAWIFPTGGHCGNLEHKDVLNALKSALLYKVQG